MSVAWNEAMTTCLQKVKAAPVALCFPMFPNTFPLAYHWHSLLPDQESRKRLRLIDWNSFDPIAEFDGTRGENASGVLFYATGEALKALKSQRDAVATEGKMDDAYVTTFQPAYVFVDNRIHYQSVKNQPFSRQVFDCLVEEYDVLEIYTDTEPQARALASRLGAWWNDNARVDVVTGERWEGLSQKPPHETVARLYMFSPAKAAVLAAQPELYVRLDWKGTEAESIFESLRDTFETHIAWYGPGVDASLGADLVAACGQYHRELYAEAGRARASKDAAAFTEVAQAYNRLARAQILRETFSGPLEFAVALDDHHQGAK